MKPVKVPLVLFALAVLCSALAVLAGCTTVAPHPVKDSEASFDGNAQNSGLIKIPQGTNGSYIVAVTDNWRARWNALILKYGAQYQVKNVDYGLIAYNNPLYPDAKWLPTKEARADFAIWNLQNKSQ